MDSYNRRRFLKTSAALLAAMASPIQLFGLTHNGMIVSRAKPAMGTLLSMKIFADTRADAIAITGKAFSEIARLEKLFSIFEPNSEISRMNLVAGKDFAPLSPEVMRTLMRAEELKSITANAVNIALLQPMRLWGFYGNDADTVNKQKIASAVKEAAQNNIIIDSTNSSAVIESSNVGIDPGGIAKGAILDSAANVLTRHGVKSGLLNGGGDIVAIGSDDLGMPWRVSLRNPLSPSGSCAIIDLSDRAMASSGGYYKFVENGNQQISHIINPRTGMPESDIISSTVIAADCLTADAMSTALSVMDWDESIRFAENNNSIEALLIRKKSNNKLDFYHTGGMQVEILQENRK